MTNYNTAKKFIKEYGLTKNYDYRKLQRTAESLGYDVYEWYPNYSADTQLFNSLKCFDLSLTSEAFSYRSDTKKIIFIKKILTEKEKKTALLHELIHIHLGHISPFKKITTAEEKQTTDVHHTIDLIFKYETKLITAAAAHTAITAVVAYKVLKMQNK